MRTLARLFLPSLLVFLLFVPAFASAVDEVEPLPIPVELLPESFSSELVAPLALSSSLTFYADAKGQPSTSIPNYALTPVSFGPLSQTPYVRVGSTFSSGPSAKTYYYFNNFVGFGLNLNAPSGSTVTVNWSGFSAYRWGSFASNPSHYSGFCPTSAGVSVYSGSTLAPSGQSAIAISPSYYIFDSNFNILAGPFGSSGSTTLVLSSPTSSLIFGFYHSWSRDNNTSVTYKNGAGFSSIAVSTSAANLSVTVTAPVTETDLLKDTNKLISISNSSLAHIDSDLHSVVSIIADLQSTISQPSAMDQFEGNYLEKMERQLSQVEDMMSPENTALPNGGDFAGFVYDVQDGLGVNGSSFNASEFADATSKFGGADSVGPGGPWEFFSQSVADSLAGDTSSIGLEDDDYIYAWLDELQRRYGLWNSSSP